MNKKLLSIAIASAMFASASQAADIQLSGFASIVGGKTLSSDETLYDYDDNLDFKKGSLFALQASSDLGEGLTATVQISASGDNDWDPEFKWAYLGYDATDNLRILAGRQVVPFYMYSDYIDVSYAYPWISPPAGVYDSIFDTFDGLGAIYNTNFGDADVSFHGIYGRYDGDIDISGSDVNISFDDLIGLSATMTYDWLTLRAGYFSANMTLPWTVTDGLAANWEGAGYSDIANNIDVDDDKNTFVELGFQMNFDALTIIGEYTDLDMDGAPFGYGSSYFITTSYLLDSVLLHVTYGADEEKRNRLTSDVPSGAGFDALVQGTDGFTDGQKVDTSYVTVGARYDFHDSAALKFEYTDYSDDNASANDAGLFRVALVTVF